MVPIPIHIMPRINFIIIINSGVPLKVFAPKWTHAYCLLEIKYMSSLPIDAHPFLHQVIELYKRKIYIDTMCYHPILRGVK